jgi:hypothetical protein
MYKFYQTIALFVLLSTPAFAEQNEHNFLYQVTPTGELFIGVMSDGDMCKAVATVLQSQAPENVVFVCRPRTIHT